MTYLLDVNVLLALCYGEHVHNQRVISWLGKFGREQPPNLALCSITELGFVRVAAGRARLASSVRAAQQDLKRLKIKQRTVFIDDTLGAHDLPLWVEGCKQVTDGHLVSLAAANHAQLVTLDEGIPGALLIPECSEDFPAVREPSLPYGSPAVWEHGEAAVVSHDSRYARAPITDGAVVAARPGARKVTSEEIYEWLRADELEESEEIMRSIGPESV
jgi:predicted nucleic acid-binding protein